MHPVKGRLNVIGGDVKLLAGHTLEAALDTDPTIRAAGMIAEDGSFDLKTLHEGTVRSGAPEGTYKVRIVLNDDDPAQRDQAARWLPPRYLQFEQSGLSLRVPTTEAVTLEIKRP